MRADYNGKFTVTADNITPIFTENGDFWRLHLDYCRSGKNNELGVYSSHQKEPRVERDGDTVTLTYRPLIAEDKTVHDITLILTIDNRPDGVHFAARMKNDSEVRINELQYPMFDFERICGELCEDTLVLPLGLGKRIKNPHKCAVCHTEYMAADYKNILQIYPYPGEMSMPWMAVESGGGLFYLGSHSDVMRMINLTVMTEPRGAKKAEFIMAVSSYPAVRPGEDITYDGFVAEDFHGDWRSGADFYREWSDSTWNKEPALLSESVKALGGWQRIILKHQYGEIFHTYDELPRIYEEGARHGITMILLFAWWEEGMDNGYPNYRPDKALGGAEKLTEAIRAINEKGGKVILYANGHLIDVSTDYYKNEGIYLTMKDIEKNEYREAYRFSNNGTLLRSGHKTFVGGCYGTSGWRDKLLEIEKRHLELGSNGTFFDQIGIKFEFCFDDTHGHGARIDLDPQYRLDAIKSMRKLLSEDEWFGTEWITDRIGMQMEFIHGCGFGMSYSPDAYPHIFRYTFPRVIISNRFLHDERDGWQRALNYAFAHGLIFDVSIWRGRSHGLEEDAPEYAEYVGRLISLRNKYREFFTEGRYDILGFSHPDSVHGSEYSIGDRKIAAVWNDSSSPVTVLGNEIPPQDVAVIEL